ncbi:MAG: hypothetical protein HY005_00775 [Candidatus Staskawiczbacteria bacterium]|nr:hypothetical protein [Candidatus Staskawiczbacteria bacterium]
MKKRLTYGQRMDLAIKLWGYFTVLTLVGFFTAAIGGGMGYTSLLIVGIIVVAIGVTLAFVSMRVRYYEEKPKLFQIDRKIRNK